MGAALAVPPPAFEATPVQVRLLDTLTDGESRLIGFGGGIRGTKTWGSLAALITLCRVFPGSRWAVVRKDLKRLRDTTIPSFEKLRTLTGGFMGPVQQSGDNEAWLARAANGSRILFRGESIDKDPKLLRFHGYEVNGFLLEEADELSERTFVKAIERAGTWIVPQGEQPPPYVLATFNPCAGWPRRRFYLPWRDGSLSRPYAFIPSTAADNPFISDEQRAAWREMPDAEYRRFVLGDWEAISGAYYDTLDPSVHLIDRDQLPRELPDYWHYWGSYDWGYAHWSVLGAWCTDTDGTHYLLDSVWLRRMQDDELAKAYRAELPERCLREVYAGHDCWHAVTAHSASGKTVAEVFAAHGIYLAKADLDKVNGGRAVNRALKVRDGRSQVYVVRTPGNLRVWDQLGEILPDPNDVRKPAKVDADMNGVGGDDGADMLRYGLATRIGAAVLPTQPHWKEPNKAEPLVVKDGTLVKRDKAPSTAAELAEWAERRAAQHGTRTPHEQRTPRWGRS